MRRPTLPFAAMAFVCLFMSVAFLPIMAAAQNQPARLPAGAGKDLVEGTCVGCHQTNQITRSSGYTEEGWKELTGTMIDLSGSPEEREKIAGYLAANTKL